MREGPPGTKASSSSFSTSTLLKEISSLRTRLKDLEDDTRSSVASDDRFFPEKEGELINMLRKELAKVENEKANLEKEFMNQMSSLAAENRKVVGGLQEKLVKCEALNVELMERLKSKHKGDEAERWMQIVEEERERHAKEVDQMKEILASSDMEIADSRREMDDLHEQLDELHVEKEELEREVEETKLLYKEEQRKSESLHDELKAANVAVGNLQVEVADKSRILDKKYEEVGEMNDTIIELESHKDMLVSEITDLRMELDKKQSGPKESKPSMPSTESSHDLHDKPITPEEKEQLEDAVKLLEERLQRFQVKLSERDRTIDNLASTLRTERKANKNLKADIKNLKDGTSDSPINGTAPSSHPSSFSQSGNRKPPPRLLTSNVKAPVDEVGKSPRTPVSGLVASFEKRISIKSTEPAPDDEASAVAVAQVSMDLKTELDKEREAVAELREQFNAERMDLEKELDNERETVAELQEQLTAEREVVKELHADLSSAVSNAKVTVAADLEMKLNESQREIDRLRSKIEEYEAYKNEFEERTRKEQSEVSKLRMKTHKAQSEKRELEQKLTVNSFEVERLKSELSMVSFQDEKKDEETEEELIRLRAQISALQSELDDAMSEIENLQAQIEGLKRALLTEQLAAKEATEKLQESTLSKKSQKAYDTQINQLKVELTKLQLAKDEMETEYVNKVKQAEQEMEALELEADEVIENKDRELNDLKNMLAEKEAKVARLQVEQAQICNSIHDMSTSRQDEIEELQTELIDMTAKTSSQAREIQLLKMKIEENEARKTEAEKKLLHRIRELEEEIMTLKRNARSQTQKQDIEQLKSENIKLRETIRDVKLERRTLKERLNALASDKTSSKSAQILRDRNAALKEEVEKLTKRLKKMEASITRFAI